MEVHKKKQFSGKLELSFSCCQRNNGKIRETTENETRIFFLKRSHLLPLKFKRLSPPTIGAVKRLIIIYNDLKMLCRPEFEAERQKNDGIVSELSQESF